jgi:hypothetical protein
MAVGPTDGGKRVFLDLVEVIAYTVANGRVSTVE